MAFKNAHTKVAEEVLGFWRYVRHEWISDRTRNLVEKKRTARLNHDMDQYKDLRRQCKKSARQDKQNWAEGEAYLATGQNKDAFAHFRNLRAACPRKISPILDDHDNLISDKSSQSSQVEESIWAATKSSFSSLPWPAKHCTRRPAGLSRTIWVGSTHCCTKTKEWQSPRSMQYNSWDA